MKKNVKTKPPAASPLMHFSTRLRQETIDELGALARESFPPSDPRALLRAILEDGIAREKARRRRRSRAA